MGTLWSSEPSPREDEEENEDANEAIMLMSPPPLADEEWGFTALIMSQPPMVFVLNEHEAHTWPLPEYPICNHMYIRALPITM